MKIIEKWKQRAKALKQELLALYLACKDPRTPWYAKAMGVCVIGYALSPIDLIPLIPFQYWGMSMTSSYSPWASRLSER